MEILSGEIIPYLSAGNINIGDKINDYINFFLDKKKYPEAYRQEGGFIRYQIGIEKFVSLVYDDLQEEILSIIIGSNFNCHYKEIIHSRMTIAELKRTPFKKFYFGNMIFLDGNFGMAIQLPNEFDDCDSLDEIPDECLIDGIIVANMDYIKNTLPNCFFQEN